MDKYDLVLDMIEHLENYTSEQLAELLAEPETREIYNLLCKTDSAIEASRGIDVDAEWECFAQKRGRRPRLSYLWRGSRAASIAAIVGSSVLAVAAGIAVTVAVVTHKLEPVAKEATIVSTAMPATTEDIITPADTVRSLSEPMMFENEPLEAIIKEVAAAYGVEVKFNNREVASLHLYYKLDTSLPLKEVVEQLNTFEQINIKQDGNILNID